jgi:hypothetical protein
MYQNLTGWLWLQRRLLDSIAVLSISILGWLCLAGWMDGYGCTVGLIQLASSDGSFSKACNIYKWLSEFHTAF